MARVEPDAAEITGHLDGGRCGALSGCRDVGRDALALGRCANVRRRDREADRDEYAGKKTRSNRHVIPPRLVDAPGTIATACGVGRAH